MSGGEGVPIGESARLAGCHAWSEEHLYEVLGRSVKVVDDAELKVVLARHARMHAEHATWLRSHLPVLAGVDHSDLVVRTGTAFEHHPLDGAYGLAAVEAVYMRILPAVIERYRHHLASASEASDAPVLRTLRLVIEDDEVARSVGLTVLDRLGRA